MYCMYAYQHCLYCVSDAACCCVLQELPVDELLVGVALLLLDAPAAQQTGLLSLGNNFALRK